MATWRDSLGRVLIDGKLVIAASFRGVPFYVEDVEYAGGRRTVSHEFPKRDENYAEDMGRAARGFPVTGYVLGDDYVAARNRLIDALEQEGPGELLHPYYGTRRVIGRFRVQERVSDGGLARFSIEFEETPAQPPLPAATPAAGARVTAAASAAGEAAAAGFLATYNVAALPASALASCSSVVQAAAAAMRDGLAPLVDDTQALAGMKRDLDALVLDAAELVQAPLEVVARLRDAVVALGSLPLTPRLGVRALLAAYGFLPSEDRPPATTPTRTRERAAYDALGALIRTLAVVQTARLVLEEEHDSYEAAVALRDEISVRLDEQAEAAGDDAYAAIVQLRADLVRAVPGEASDLPRLVRYTPPVTVPSLVLAHRLYGNLDREADIVTRNRVAHPGFVVGGSELEVLADAR
jgi:prophage DNA circulation protein